MAATWLGDLIRFFVPTTGTGSTLSIGSAVSPFMTPATYGAPFNSGTTLVFYSILDVVGGGSETGTITYNATGPTMTGRTPITSTNSNSAIDLSGLAQMVFTAIGSAIVNKTGDTMTGTLSVPGLTDTLALTLSGTISPTALSGAVNDYAPTGIATALTVRIDGGAADRNITGIAASQADGRVLRIVNIGTTNSLTLVNQSGSSTAANQFLLPADTILPINTSLALEYDGTTSRWRPWARALSNTGVTAGSYTLSSVTIDAAGRVTAASSGSVAGVAYTLVGDSGAISGSPATVSFTSLDVTDIIIVCVAILPSTNAGPNLAFSTNNGSSYTSSVTINTAGTSAQYLALFFSGLKGGHVSGLKGSGGGTTDITTTPNSTTTGIIMYAPGSQINAIQFGLTAGTFTSGRIYIYGR